MRATFLAVALSIIVLAAGCSKKDDSGLTPIESTSATATPGCADETGRQPAKLGIIDYRFDKACFAVMPYQAIELENNGESVHNFSIERARFAYDVLPGKVVRTKRTFLDPGTYAFYCKYHRASGMGGALRVKAPPTPVPTPTPQPTPTPATAEPTVVPTAPV